MVGLRMDPTDVDAEAAIESRDQGREVNRSEMMKMLMDEALAARKRRHNRKARE